MRLSVFRNMAGTRAFKDASVLGLAHVLTLLLGLASTVVWTRWIPAETFGQYKVVLGIISIAGTFCLLGIGQVVLMSAASKADGNLLRLIRSKLLANLGGTLLILGAASYYYLSRSDSDALVGGLVAAAIIFPIYNSSELWLSWLNGKGKFGSLAAGRLITSTLALCAALLIVLFNINEVWLVIFLFLALPSLQNVLMLRRAVSLKSNDEHNENLMRLGRHTSFALIFVSLLSLDVVLLEHFYKAEEVALYVVALAFPEQVKGLFSIVGQVIAPKIFAGESLAKLWPSLRKKFLLITLVFTGLGLIGFILIPFLVPLLFTAKYAAAGDYGKCLWLAISCTGSFTYLGSALIRTGRPTYIYTPSVGYPLCLLAFYLVLIDYGASGMIYARSASAVLLAAYYGFAFAYELRSQKMSITPSES